MMLFITGYIWFITGYTMVHNRPYMMLFITGYIWFK